jgi:hypothetical protein
VIESLSTSAIADTACMSRVFDFPRSGDDLPDIGSGHQSRPSPRGTVLEYDAGICRQPEFLIGHHPAMPDGA